MRQIPLILCTLTSFFKLRLQIANGIHTENHVCKADATKHLLKTHILRIVYFSIHVYSIDDRFRVRRCSVGSNLFLSVITQVAGIHLTSVTSSQMCVSETVLATLRLNANLSQDRQYHIDKSKWFPRLANAVHTRLEILQHSDFDSHDIGVYARDININGAKQYAVQTHVGAACFFVSSLSHSVAQVEETSSVEKRCRQTPIHYYEVVLENTPCWLYFDLDYSCVLHPHLVPADVTHAFYDTLTQFCLIKFGMQLCVNTVVELDSTNSEKYSKHFVVKHMYDDNGNLQALAFPHNGHAGQFVKDFLSFLAKECADNEHSIAHCLRYRTHTKQKDHQVEEWKNVIDSNVYDRNRCFRLLFSSQMGKHTELKHVTGCPVSAHPSIQLLASLVTCVSRRMKLFTYIERVPLKVSDSKQPYPQDDDQREHTKQSGKIIKINDTRKTGTQNSEKIRSALMAYLIAVWDLQRSSVEATDTSYVQMTSGRWIEKYCHAQFLVLRLSGNRFCYRKKASHKSNSVFLVVDVIQKVFYQKCADTTDCAGFRSQEFPISDTLLSDI